MTRGHVVRFGAGRARRYLCTADATAGAELRHPLVWERDAARALVFPTSAEAHAVALRMLGHGLFDTGPAPARSIA